jgi:hypothetical protein
VKIYTGLAGYNYPFKHNELKWLKSYAKPGYYVRFSKFLRLGINPLANRGSESPIGVYTYAIKDHIEDIRYYAGEKRTQIMDIFGWAEGMRYVLILKERNPNSRKIETGKYTEAQYLKDFEILRAKYGKMFFAHSLFKNPLAELSQVSPVPITAAPTYRIWKLVHSIAVLLSHYSPHSKNIKLEHDYSVGYRHGRHPVNAGLMPIISRRIFVKDLGYSAVIDHEGQVIFEFDGPQTVFFNATDLEMVDSRDRQIPHYEDVPISARELRDEIKYNKQRSALNRQNSVVNLTDTSARDLRNEIKHNIAAINLKTANLPDTSTMTSPTGFQEESFQEEMSSLKA